MELNKEREKAFEDVHKKKFGCNNNNNKFECDEKEKEFDGECSDSSSITTCDEKPTDSFHIPNEDADPSTMTEDADFCMTDSMDPYMTESIETNFSDIQFKDSWKCSPCLVFMAVILIMMFLSSLANISSFQDCDAVIAQVKLISEQLKADNELFKSQLVAEVHEKMYTDLLSKIHALKAESEKLNGILQRIANRGYMPFMSSDDIYFGNNTADSVDKIRSLFLKDSAVLTLKICTAFLIFLGLVKLALNCQRDYKIKMQNLRKFFINIKRAVRFNRKV